MHGAPFPCSFSVHHAIAVWLAVRLRRVVAHHSNCAMGGARDESRTTEVIDEPVARLLHDSRTDGFSADSLGSKCFAESKSLILSSSAGQQIKTQALTFVETCETLV